MYEDIQANHPGPVNADDPGFSARNAAALQMTLSRARQVSDYAGYVAALSGDAASFDDGHLNISFPNTAHDWPHRWPGFLTGYDTRGRILVRNRADDAPIPLDAELLSCDGRPAAALAQQNVGSFVGRWFLPSTRIESGWQLFEDRGNPFIALPQRCRFKAGQGERDIVLQWRTFPASERQQRINEVFARARPPIAVRQLPDGAYWYQLSDFRGEPNSPAAQALPLDCRHASAA